MQGLPVRLTFCYKIFVATFTLEASIRRAFSIFTRSFSSRYLRSMSDSGVNGQP